MNGSDVALLKKLLLILGGIHSSSGVSIGRSYRSDIRQTIMELLEIENQSLVADERARLF